MEAVDPRTKKPVPLFNPRADKWDEHFAWNANYTRMLGKTPTGRATVVALRMNDRPRQRARRLWLLLDLIP